jgi:hypothetical protein
MTNIFYAMVANLLLDYNYNNFALYVPCHL